MPAPNAIASDKLARLIDSLAVGEVPVPGPQNGRFSSEPLGGPVALAHLKGTDEQYNASVARAVRLNDTIKRIDGTEVPVTTPWRWKAETVAADDGMNG